MPLRALVALVMVGFVQGCAERALDEPDHATDLSVPRDMAVFRDAAVPDLSTLDFAKHDFATPDLAAHDLATVDLADADLAHAFPTCSTVTVSTLTGNGFNAPGLGGFFDGTGGPNGTTEFASPQALAVDGSGNLYVADWYNNRIRKVAPDGSTTTLAGNGTGGFVDGTGGPNGTTMFEEPSAVAVDPTSGAILVADAGNHRIRRIDPSTGATTTLSGNGTNAFADGTGGPNGTAEFWAPQGIVVDALGYAYVGDAQNHRVRKIAPDGMTTTLAGNGTSGYFDGTGGPTGTTTFNYPMGLDLDSSGNLYVADLGNNAVRRVAPNGDTITVAGQGPLAYGFMDGNKSVALFWNPTSVTVDPGGWLYVSDASNSRIRAVKLDGTSSTLAGDGNLAFLDGTGCTAELRYGGGMALSGRTLFVADEGNDRIRKITLP